MLSPKEIQSVALIIHNSLDDNEHALLSEIIKAFKYKDLTEFIASVSDTTYLNNTINSLTIKKNNPFIDRLNQLEKEGLDLELYRNNAIVLMKVLNTIEIFSTRLQNTTIEEQINTNDELIGILTDMNHVENSERLIQSIDYHKQRNELLKFKVSNKQIAGVSLLMFDGLERDLNNLRNYLVNSGLIESDSDFVNHFIIKNQPNPSAIKIKKIAWDGTMNELTDMFVCLIELKYLPEVYLKSPFKHIVQHFCDKRGKDYNNKILSNRYREINQYVLDKKPRLIKPFPEPLVRIRTILLKLID